MWPGPVRGTVVVASRVRDRARRRRGRGGSRGRTSRRDRGRGDRGRRDRRRGARHGAGPRRVPGAPAGAPDELPRQGPGGDPRLLGRGGDARAGPREAAARRRRSLRHPGRPVRRGDRPRDREGAGHPAGPAAARRSRRALRRAGPAGEVPGRLPVPLPARRGGLPVRPTGRTVRLLPHERHLDRRPVRTRCRAHRRRGGLERPDHRSGPVDRAAGRAHGGRRRPRRPGPLGHRVHSLRAGAAGADASAPPRREDPDRARGHLHPVRRGAAQSVLHRLPHRPGARRPAAGRAAGAGEVPAEAFGPENVARILAMG